MLPLRSAFSSFTFLLLLVSLTIFAVPSMAEESVPFSRSGRVVDRRVPRLLKHYRPRRPVADPLDSRTFGDNLGGIGYGSSGNDNHGYGGGNDNNGHGYGSGGNGGYGGGNDNGNHGGYGGGDNDSHGGYGGGNNGGYGGGGNNGGYGGGHNGGYGGGDNGGYGGGHNGGYGGGGYTPPVYGHPSQTPPKPTPTPYHPPGYGSHGY